MEPRAADSLRLARVDRPLWIRALSIPWLLLTETEPRARIRVIARGNGAVIHQTRWLSNAGATYEAMAADLEQLGREEFLSLWCA